MAWGRRWPAWRSTAGASRWRWASRSSERRSPRWWRRRAAGPSVQPEVAQLPPARIRLALVRMVRPGLVEVRAAVGTQPRAVGPAQDLVRQRQGQRVARPGAD